MQSVLKIKNLKKRFGLDAGFFAKADKFVYAVNDVSFEIQKGKTYGLVGESGCGKTTVARLIVKMYNADSGRVLFNDGENETDIASFSKKQLKEYRQKVKYVFQDPSRSLNPRKNIFQILTDGLKHSNKWQGKQKALEDAQKMMEEIGFSKEDLFRRPSEFSGGQRQRISIARSLMMNPQVLICDEIVSALDVSIQAQILNLLQDLRQKFSLSFLFIAHDLKVSCYFCDTIGVMYRGVLVEEADAKDLFETALHPYTQLLFAGAGSKKFEQEKSGEMKTLLENLKGCPFAHRCRNATEKCLEALPEWKEVSQGHKVRCWMA